MSIRFLATFGALVLLAVIAVTAWAWFQIPADAMIPTHWDINGHVNGRMTKAPALLISPAVMLAISLIFLAITRMEPRQNNLLRSRMLFAVGWIGALAVFSVSQGIVIAAALGLHPPINAIVLPLVALFMIAIGNAMPKTRSNFFVGVRTPWTLESDYSWEKTHRWTGRFFVATGIATLAVFALVGSAAAIVTFTAGILASALAAIVLSYVFWQRDPERHAHDSVPE